MIKTLLPLSSLFLSFIFLCLANGLQNTLIGVRATLENFPDWVVGFMMSIYFVGFLAGAIITPYIINRVGQIRTFAAFASLFSSTSLLHILMVDPFGWIIFRFLHGFSMATLIVVIESWLNASSNGKNRGKVLSVYMIINFLCLSLSQLFMLFSDPMQFTLFALVSVLASLSLMPLLLSRMQQPSIEIMEHISLHSLIRISPLATFGTFITGVCSGAFWGMSAVYFTKIGMIPANIAWFISLSFLGGLLFQWPIGYLSDYFNRRVAIVLCSLVSAISTLLILFFAEFEPQERIHYLLPLGILFGGFYYPLYSLAISLANDFLKPEQFIKASSKLLFLHAIGAIIGPMLAASCMMIMGDSGLFVLLTFLFTSLLAFAALRIASGRAIPEETTGSFVQMPRTITSSVLLEQTH